MNIDQKLLDEVKSLYGKTDSIRETAAEVGLSDQKVRRLLITAGVKLNNATTKRILSLYQAGKTPEEIARIEGKTRNAVIAHLPYSRGPLKQWTAEERESVARGEHPAGRTANAARVARSRAGIVRDRKNTTLRRLREKAHLTQAQLAKKANISLSAVRAYEQEQRDIHAASAETVQALATVLNCEIKDILS